MISFAKETISPRSFLNLLPILILSIGSNNKEISFELGAKSLMLKRVLFIVASYQLQLFCSRPLYPVMIERCFSKNKCDEYKNDRGCILRFHFIFIKVHYIDHAVLDIQLI